MNFQKAGPLLPAQTNSRFAGTTDTIVSFTIKRHEDDKAITQTGRLF
ncbi:MAG: hypothetical protein QM791_19090 [Ferruginibacter sp.]